MGGKQLQTGSRSGDTKSAQNTSLTDPNLTILHVNGSRIDRQRLKRFLRIYQSSSPSYLFLAAMEEALDRVSADREKLFDEFQKSWLAMLKELKNAAASIF